MRNLQLRSKSFAVNVIRFCRTLPKTPEARVIRDQLLRSATSVGANYRAACHAHTKKAFIHKLSIVEEEADESQFWLEVLTDLQLGQASKRDELQQEARELTSIIVASKKTARSRPGKRV